MAVGIDPISAGISGAIDIGKTALDYFSKQKAGKHAKENEALQRQNIASQMYGAGEQRAGIEQQRAALAEQMARAQAVEDLARAGKHDVYGNLTQFDPATGRVEQILTPDQQDIINASERNKMRMQSQAAQAGPAFSRLLSEYTNQPAPSQDAIMAEIITMMNNAQGTGDRAANTLIDRQDLRQRGNMPVINQGTREGSSTGQRLAQTMLQARQQAVQEAAMRGKAHNDEYLPGLSALSSVETGANNLGPDPYASRLGADQDSVFNNIVNAMTGTMHEADVGNKLIGEGYGRLNTAYGNIDKAYGGVNTAYENTTKALTGNTAGKSTTGDIANLAKAFSALKGTGTGNAPTNYTSDAVQPDTDPWAGLR
jgi:hypothetical protein